jgi:hypothetical protein
MNKIFLYCIMLSIILSCQTTDTCRQWDDSLFFASFTALQDNEKFLLSVKFNAKNEPNNLFSDFITGKNSISVIVMGNNEAIDTVEFTDLYPSGIADKKGKAIVAIYGVTEWRNPTSIKNEDLIFSFNLMIGEKCYHYDTKPKLSDETVSNEDVLTLYPSINKDSDSTATFVLYAQRNKLKTDEYLPSSEKLRIIIFSEKGEVKWNSSFNKNFLQVVTPVYPENVGGIYKYSLKWDGYDTYGRQLPPGNYRVQMIIPAQPKMYSESIEFRWKN